jgi:hypothetical protein
MRTITRTIRLFLAAVAALAVTAVVLPTPADAASSGWYWYPRDMNGNGYYDDMAVYYDSSGWRLDWWVYFDLTGDRTLDTAARDFDRDGKLDQAWYNLDQRGGYDVASDLKTTFFCAYPGQQDSNHAMYEGFGSWWGHCSNTFSTVEAPVWEPISALIINIAKINRSVVG